MRVHKRIASGWISIILLFIGLLFGFERKWRSNKNAIETTRRAMAFEKRRGEEMSSAMKEGDTERYDELWKSREREVNSGANNVVTWRWYLWICLVGVGGLATGFTHGWRRALSCLLLMVHVVLLMLPR